MEKFKMNKKMVMSIFASGIVLLSGCSKESSVDKESEVNEMISNTVTFNDVLDSVSDTTTVDENLSSLGYESILSEYVKCRTDEDLYGMCNQLEKLGKIILESAVCDELGIELKDVNKFYVSEGPNTTDEGHVYYVPYCEISYYSSDSEVVAGGIAIDSNNNNKKTYYLKNEGNDIAINIWKCRIHSIQDLNHADRIFKSYQRFILTSAKLEKDNLSFDYDDNKIEQYKNYVIK